MGFLFSNIKYPGSYYNKLRLRVKYIHSSSALWVGKMVNNSSTDNITPKPISNTFKTTRRSVKTAMRQLQLNAQAYHQV
jgi:hypothetical protein